MAYNEKKNKKGFKWFFLLSLIFFVFEKLFKAKKDKKYANIEKNFKEFLHKESKEIEKYRDGDEGTKEFATEASNIFKDYFIPHSGNNHVPRILERKSLAIMAILALALKLSLVAYLYFVFPYQGSADQIPISRVLSLINEERAKKSLKPLVLDQNLNASALAKANDIVTQDYFAHTSPDGRRPWDFVDRNIYPYKLVGENLAMNFTTAESAHRALVNSPSHLKNILNEKYEDVGLAVVKGEIAGKSTNVLVQIFSSKVVKASEPEQKDHDLVARDVEVSEDNVSVLAIENDLVAKNTSEEPVVKEPAIKPNTPQNTKIEEKVEQNESIISRSDNKEENLTKKDQPRDTVEQGSESNTIRVINHPGDEEVMANAKKIEDEELLMIAQREKTLAEVSTSVENAGHDSYIFSAAAIRATQIALASILSLLIISLVVNIFIRFEIQHKPVLIRTVLLTFFVLALLFINFHYLEGGMITIYMS